MEFKHYLSQQRIMRNIKRFSMETVIHPQNLADHGYNVGTIFYLLCKAKGVELTADKLFMVMNHDFAETYTGDLNKRVKEKDCATMEAWNTIEWRSIPCEVMYLSDASIARDLTSEEYRLFLLADALDAFFYCVEEVNKGNTYLKEAKTHYYDAIEKLFNTYTRENEEWFKFLWDPFNGLHGIIGGM